MRARWRSPAGPLVLWAGHLAPFVASLIDQQYAASVVHVKVRHTVSFDRWLAKRGVALADLGEIHIEQYQRRRREGYEVTALLGFLRTRGVCEAAQANSTPAEDLAAGFGQHLQDQQGLAAATTARYTTVARQSSRSAAPPGSTDRSELLAASKSLLPSVSSPRQVVSTSGMAGTPILPEVRRCGFQLRTPDRLAQQCEPGIVGENTTRRLFQTQWLEAHRHSPNWCRKMAPLSHPYHCLFNTIFDEIPATRRGFRLIPLCLGLIGAGDSTLPPFLANRPERSEALRFRILRWMPVVLTFYRSVRVNLNSRDPASMSF